MLGLLLIYFIWKQFADLATQYDKSRWGFGILGVVTYYAGTFFAGVVFAIFSPDFIESADRIVVSLVAIPFGILFCVILYFVLKKIWEKNYVNIYEQIESIGEPEQNHSHDPIDKQPTN